MISMKSLWKMQKNMPVQKVYAPLVFAPIRVNKNPETLVACYPKQLSINFCRPSNTLVPINFPIFQIILSLGGGGGVMVKGLSGVQLGL